MSAGSVPIRRRSQGKHSNVRLTFALCPLPIVEVHVQSPCGYLEFFTLRGRTKQNQRIADASSSSLLMLPHAPTIATRFQEAFQIIYHYVHLINACRRLQAPQTQPRQFCRCRQGYPTGPRREENCTRCLTYSGHRTIVSACF